MTPFRVEGLVVDGFAIFFSLAEARFSHSGIRGSGPEPLEFLATNESVPLCEEAFCQGSSYLLELMLFGASVSFRLEVRIRPAEEGSLSGTT